MAERDRLGPEVRSWTRRLAGLMRTPDEGLEAFAIDQALPEGVDVGQLRLLRAILDELAAGMEAPPGAAYWVRLAAVQRALAGAPAAPPAPPAPLESRGEELDRTAPNPVLDLAAMQAKMPHDFRRELVVGHPDPRPAPPAPPGDWRPSDPAVTPPVDAQAQTMGDVPDQTLDDEAGGTLGFDEWEAGDLAPDATTVNMRAVVGALDWPLERAAAMTVALAQHTATGRPAIDEVCAQLGLRDRAALEVARRTWERRFALDPDLRRRHDELVRAWTDPEPPR